MDTLTVENAGKGRISAQKLLVGVATIVLVASTVMGVGTFGRTLGELGEPASGQTGSGQTPGGGGSPDPSSGSSSGQAPDPTGPVPGQTPDVPDDQVNTDPASNDPGSGDPNAAPDQNAPATTTTSIPVSENPPDWPMSLPGPGTHLLLGYNPQPEQRWVLGMPGSVQLIGGKLLAGLNELGWNMSSVSTPDTLSSVGANGPQRVALAIRQNDGSLPQGWVYVEIIYQAEIPPFDLPVPSETPEERARRRA